MIKEEFKVYLDSLNYDKYWQDIEYIDFIGRSRSYQTWELMRDMYNWKGKQVVDIGCFHGYYCFKAEQLGAIVMGLDRSPEILTTANILKKEYNSSVDFKLWNAGFMVPGYFDIALLMVISYGLPNAEETIKNINCKNVLFDVADYELPLIEKYYHIIEKKAVINRESTSGNWSIILGERKSNSLSE